MNKDIPLRRENTLRAVFWGGLLCGVLDIAYALALYGMLGIRPVRLLQGIASGIMGPSAFTRGLSTAAYGLLLHFVIAFGAFAAGSGANVNPSPSLEQSSVCPSGGPKRAVYNRLDVTYTSIYIRTPILSFCDRSCRARTSSRLAVRSCPRSFRRSDQRRLFDS